MNGKIIVSGDSQKFLRIWDTNQEIQQIKFLFVSIQHQKTPTIIRNSNISLGHYFSLFSLIFIKSISDYKGKIQQINKTIEFNDNNNEECKNRKTSKINCQLNPIAAKQLNQQPDKQNQIEQKSIIQIHQIKCINLIMRLNKKNPYIILLNGNLKIILQVSMVMEYIETGDLQKYIQNKRKFSYYDIALIYQNMKSALQYLHDNKIIHRDITRRNILIKEENCIIMKTVLTDLGISSVIQQFKTKQFTKNGSATSYYKAPQFIQKLQISFATDLWNLGIVMIELTLGGFIEDFRQKQPGLCKDFPQIELDLINKKEQYRNFVPIIKTLLEKYLKKREMIQL